MAPQAQATGLSQSSADALGYAGGGVLAVCLIPQIARLIITRCDICRVRPPQNMRHGRA
jgi:hypothetical protein